VWYSLEIAVFVSKQRECRWGVDSGKQKGLWSVVVRAWWVEVGWTVAVNLLHSG
jgi:hypothetical protein